MTDKSPEALIAEARERQRKCQGGYGFDRSDERLMWRLADALERERERNAKLVEALEQVADDGCYTKAWDTNCNDECRAIARKALEETDGE